MIVHMNYQQYRTARRLVHSCCNYDCGNCLLLDGGEECICPQSITAPPSCPWTLACAPPCSTGQTGGNVYSVAVTICRNPTGRNTVLIALLLPVEGKKRNASANVTTILRI